jgi:sulfur-carrier protein
MITLLYFGPLKDITSKMNEQITYQPGLTVGVIRKLLVDSYGTGIGPLLDASGVAVNQEYVEENRVLEEGDEIVFIPPVSSG